MSLKLVTICGVLKYICVLLECEFAIVCCRYWHCGVVAGKLFMMLVVIDYLLLLLLTWLVPEKVWFSGLIIFSITLV